MTTKDKKERPSSAIKKRTRRKLMTRAGPLTVREELKDKNFVYRWVNDKDWNLQDKIDRGYEFVEDVDDKMQIKDIIIEDSKLGAKVTKPVGGGTRGYLMRQRKEWYEEDQADKAKMNEEIMRAEPDSPNIYNKQFDIDRPKLDD